MCDIVRSTRFKRDYKREKKGRYASILHDELYTVLQCLASGKTLPDQYRDHQLAGRWNGCRDCHVKPDLVLIYRIKSGSLELVRMGSHSELEL